MIPPNVWTYSKKFTVSQEEHVHVLYIRLYRYMYMYNSHYYNKEKHMKKLKLRSSRHNWYLVKPKDDTTNKTKQVAMIFKITIHLYSTILRDMM